MINSKKNIEINCLNCNNTGIFIDDSLGNSIEKFCSKCKKGKLMRKEKSKIKLPIGVWKQINNRKYNIKKLTQ